MTVVQFALQNSNQNIVVVVPHRAQHDMTVESKAREEFTLLKSSASVLTPYAKPLRYGGSSTLAHRSYYQGCLMFDIRIELKKYLGKLKPKINFPKYLGGDPLGLSKCSRDKVLNGKHFITHLERCEVNGVRHIAHEIKSEGQARYVYNQMDKGLPIDFEQFYELELEGMHLDSLLGSSKYPATDANQLEGSIIPVSEDKSYLVSPQNNQYSVTDYNGNIQYRATESDARFDLIPPIYEMVKEIQSTLDVGAIRGNELTLELISQEVISQVVSQTMNRFETGILLNEEGEKFIVMLFDRIEEILASNGGKKRTAFLQVKEEIDIAETEFNRLKKCFMDCKLGVKKGKDVSYYDIQEYYTRTFKILLDVDTGSRRVVKIWKERRGKEKYTG